MTLNGFAFVVWEREGRHQSREVYTIRTEDKGSGSEASEAE